MSNKYTDIWNTIEQFNKISLFTHVDPDGDTIASAVGLKHLILNNFKHKEVKIIGDKFPTNLRFLGKSNQAKDEYIKDSLVIIIDTSTLSRIHDQRYVLSQNKIKIDHHHDEGGEWLVNISGDHFAATGEIIVDLAIANNLIISIDSAVALLTSIYSDTEGFTHRQITKKTHSRVGLLKKAGASLEFIQEEYNDLGHSNKFVEYIKNNKQVIKNTSYINISREVVEKFNPDLSLFKAYVRALKEEGIDKWSLIIELNNYIRIGIRSNDDYDVSKIAKAFGGGGHKVSAGTKVDSWKKADEFIKEFIKY